MMSPQAPVSQPDPKARVARAGYVCGLGILAATVLAIVAIADMVPVMSSGEGVILAIAIFPFAVLGTVLSVRGRTSTTRRDGAIVGLVCCLVYFVFVVLGVLSLSVHGVAV